MNRKLYTSDLHIGHRRALDFDSRPFATLKEMHKAIVDNWNEAVNESDDVYILGDMFWNNAYAADILSRLKGNKHLILGNHDRLNAEMVKHFVSIDSYKEIKDNGKRIILCHYPIAHWKNADHGTIHLYGHIHAGRDSRPFEEYVALMRERGIPYECYNVGCMLWDYTPRTLEEIRNFTHNKDESK